MSDKAALPISILISIQFSQPHADRPWLGYLRERERERCESDTEKGKERCESQIEGERGRYHTIEEREREGRRTMQNTWQVQRGSTRLGEHNRINNS